jgi:hypothetical protein
MKSEIKEFKELTTCNVGFRELKAYACFLEERLEKVEARDAKLRELLNKIKNWNKDVVGDEIIKLNVNDALLLVEKEVKKKNE